MKSPSPPSWTVTAVRSLREFSSPPRNAMRFNNNMYKYTLLVAVSTAFVGFGMILSMQLLKTDDTSRDHEAIMMGIIFSSPNSKSAGNTATKEMMVDATVANSGTSDELSRMASSTEGELSFEHAAQPPLINYEKRSVLGSESTLEPPLETSKQEKDIAIPVPIQREDNTNNKTTVLQLNKCGNSKIWLDGPRHGNLNTDHLLTNDLAKNLILNLKDLLISEQRHTVYGQTICHANGRFRNDAMAGFDFDETTVRLWSVRLIYLAMHYHQHRLAIPEAIQRYEGGNPSCSPDNLMANHSVSRFDYECPDAQYLILMLSGNGLGSNVRGGLVPAFLMALSADRILRVINNVAGGSGRLKNPWLLSSCPRGDFQCFFMPESPCTITIDQINNAHKLEPNEFRRLSKHLLLSSETQQSKVWSFDSKFLPGEKIGDLAISKINEYAQILIDAVPKTPENENFIKLLKLAQEDFQVVDKQRENTYNYAARWNKIVHAITMYTMRPNPSSALALDKIMEEIIPEKFEPENSIGLPIRASDKCIKESECLTFDEHMRVVNGLWNRHLNETGRNFKNPTIVFTTEAEGMMQEKHDWVKAGGIKKSPFEYDFLTNTRDLMPNSGFIKDVVRRKDGDLGDPDNNMLSSMSSLKLQLLPRVSVGNCCSNFHAMLNDFLSEGCGAAKFNSFLCLQEHDDPLLQICCGWHHDCIQRKRMFREQYEARLNETETRMSASNQS